MTYVTCSLCDKLTYYYFDNCYCSINNEKIELKCLCPKCLKRLFESDYLVEKEKFESIGILNSQALCIKINTRADSKYFLNNLNKCINDNHYKAQNDHYDYLKNQLFISENKLKIGE